jgi:hypothetical protein
VKEIIGTTIDDPELKVARDLPLINYEAVLHNKFSGDGRPLKGTFDFIIDNNPTSPCCCVRHLATLFDFYLEKLSTEGQIVTDAEGLQWVPDDSSPRWSFDFDDLAAAGAIAGFSAFKATKYVYVLSRSKPPAADTSALFRHALRRTSVFPGKLVKSGPRVVVRLCRKSLKWLIYSTVPSSLLSRYRTKK